MPSTPKLLITSGEPAGIGPELLVKIAQKPLELPLTVVGDPALFESRAQQIGLSIKTREVDALALEAGSDDLVVDRQLLNVIPIPLKETSVAGMLAANNAEYVVKTLQVANDLCLSGQFDGIVTGPVQKSVINDAGIPFSGHTEFFAAQSNVEKVVMMLSTEGLRVALVTTHLPLSAVPAAVTKNTLGQVLDILISELKTKFRIQTPRILVAGLNPHAGEGGHLGTEEIDTIVPVLAQYKDIDASIVGPLPADTLFTPRYLSEADAVLAMYHDQGLPVLKHKGFGSAVNITLGLPYIRTSVDHGTALDMAGKGIADESSFLEAIKVANSLATPPR